VVGVEIREVDGIKGPAAFGWLRPVILLPEGMPAGPVRYAALLHELQHVIRRDWLENVLERAAASLLWFHPMIWWLLERIHLTREQAVDSEVAGAGAERDHYLHALLSSAGLANLPALPVAGFVRRPRHLVERVAFLSEEYKMSKRATAASAALAALVSGAALAAAAFYLPLQLTAQQAEDSPLHWTRMTRIGEGTVQLEAIVNSAGEVVDARVVSGPDELRKQALQSVLVSHFAKDSAERRILPVTIDFRKSLEAVAGGLVGGVTGGIIGGVPAPPALEQATFEGVDYAGLSTELQQRAAGLMASLRSGQKITTAQVEQFRGELAAIDPSLRLGLSMRESGDGKGTLLRFNVNNLPAPERIRVGAAVQDQNLISKVEPEYPALARQARIQGTVRFQIMIGKDGSVQQIQLVSGHPLLVEPAQKAVSQYKYKPTLLNGNQIAVQTLVDVNFVL
jgi:TonB family protein